MTICDHKGKSTFLIIIFVFSINLNISFHILPYSQCPRTFLFYDVCILIKACNGLIGDMNIFILHVKICLLRGIVKALSVSPSVLLLYVLHVKIHLLSGFYIHFCFVRFSINKKLFNTKGRKLYYDRLVASYLLTLTIESDCIFMEIIHTKKSRVPSTITISYMSFLPLFQKLRSYLNNISLQYHEMSMKYPKVTFPF